MSKINKLCVDSRFRVSGTTSDFRVEVPESIHLPENMGCMLTDISIPHTWYSIDELNSKLYIRIDANGTITDQVLTLVHRNYDINTLAQELHNVIGNAVSPFTVSATPIDYLGTITVATTWPVLAFKILTNDELYNNLNGTWTGASYDPRNPHSCNDVLRNDAAKWCNFVNSFQSGFVDTISNHSVYITSPQLGSFLNIGPRGERTILKKVLVNVGYGSIITDTLLNTDDYTDCSRQLIKTLDFKLTDVYGNALNLHGAHISFSVVFKNI